MSKLFLIVTLFLVYSFLGWCVESIYCFIIDKKFVNRGFLIGPCLPIYGFGCIIIVTVLNVFRDNPILLFIMATLICSVLEYITSYIMEKIFKTRWWDYSQMKFNLYGRICLRNMLFFGVLALLMSYLVNPFVLDLLSKINVTLLKIFVSIFFVLFVIDIIISSKIIYNIKGLNTSAIKDQTEEISARVKEALMSKGVLTRRVANAFPNFKVRVKLKNKKDKNNSKS